MLTFLQLPLTAWCSALYLEHIIMPRHLGTVLPEVLPVEVFLHYFALLILKCKICHPPIEEQGIK